jgi:hypothetical protein
MAKDYIRGADYRLYLNTGSYVSPTWVNIAAASEIDVATNPDDVTVPERGSSTGHLQGEDDPAITFTLLEDAGDANVETLIAAMFSGDMEHIAVSRGDIETTGTRFWHLEACLMGVSLGAARGDAAQYAVEARRHANSDNDLVRETAS